MSIASEITRISGNIADAYTSLNAKGATMPATQNSANLADTIDSITTGGGGGGTPVYRGGWQVPDLYLQIDVATDDTTNELYQAYMSVQSSGSIPRVMGIKLHKGVYTLKFSSSSWSSYIDALYISDGRMYHSSSLSSVAPSGSVQGSSSTEISIDNSKNDIYLIYYFRTYQNTINLNNSSNKAYIKGYGYDTSEQYIARFIEYAACKNIFFSGEVANLKSFYIIGELPSAAKTSNPKTFVFNENDSEFEARKYIPPISEWCSTSTYTLSSASFLQKRNVGCFPDGLELATSANGTIYIGYAPYGLDTQLHNSTFGSAKIVLPSTNSVSFAAGIILTAEDWAYIAEHAPAVSGLTLTMGTANIQVCGGSSGTIITTLTNKGWTVN